MPNKCVGISPKERDSSNRPDVQISCESATLRYEPYSSLLNGGYSIWTKLKSYTVSLCCVNWNNYVFRHKLMLHCWQIHPKERPALQHISQKLISYKDSLSSTEMTTTSFPDGEDFWVLLNEHMTYWFGFKRCLSQYKAYIFILFIKCSLRFNNWEEQILAIQNLPFLLNFKLCNISHRVMHDNRCCMDLIVQSSEIKLFTSNYAFTMYIHVCIQLLFYWKP